MNASGFRQRLRRASDTTDEFGDLIGEEGEFGHVYDAMANTEAPWGAVRGADPTGVGFRLGGGVGFW